MDPSEVDVSLPGGIEVMLEKAAAARRSVQLSEGPSVNWARPLKVEPDNPPTCIFGESIQRSRRLNQANLSPIPSPSSEGGLVTPNTVQLDEGMYPSKNLEHSPQWSLTTPARGLGVSGITAWDSPLTDYLDLSENDSTKSPSPSPSPMAINRSRMTSSSNHLDILSSPATLDELRSLRRALGALEMNARAPIRERQPSVSTSRKTKRKAVPLFDETIFQTSSSDSSPSNSIRNIDVFTSPRMHQIPVDPPLYQIPQVAYSTLEISPRSASLPLHIPPRVASHRSESSSSSSMYSDQPVTPTSEKEAFMDQMEFGLSRLGSGMHRQRSEAQEPKIVVAKESQSAGKRHKRTLSRFFGRVMADI